MSLIINDPGCFYLTLAATLQPFYGAYAAYSPSPTDPTAGLETEGFNASFGSSTPAFVQQFFLGYKNLTEIEMSSRVLPSFLQSIMFFLLDMFLSDQSRPCLDFIHGGHWRWSYDRKLLLLGNARDCTCSEVSSCKSFLMVLPRCLDLITDTWVLIFRAEGLFYSRPVSVGGIYYFPCCLQLWISHCSFPSVIYLTSCRDFLN